MLRAKSSLPRIAQDILKTMNERLGKEYGFSLRKINKSYSVSKEDFIIKSYYLKNWIIKVINVPFGIDPPIFRAYSRL